MSETNQIIAGSDKPAARRSVRMKLLAITLLPMLVVLPLLLGLTVVRWSSQFDRLLISKVNGDLTIAHQYLSRILENSGEKIQALGASTEFANSFPTGEKSNSAGFMEKSRVALGFDFLYLLRPDGTIIASAPANIKQGDLTKFSLVGAALAGQANTVIDILDGDNLNDLSFSLARQARVDLVPTEAAVPTDQTVESRGMIVHTATPISLGQAQGALVGGILLNRNLAFIDTINDLVYSPASLPQGSTGTATLFLDDVRISTNVRLFENVRALGTRVSAIVRARVLDEGQVWLDRAFVVNNWYISAYEPIIDSGGKRVGMLYVGFLETPFLVEKYTTLAVIAGLFLLVAALFVPVLLRWARSIFKPLEQMTQTIALVEGGNLSARTGAVGQHDEIGRVAQHLDTLLEQLQERDRTLNKRVIARTRDLKQANQQLEATTQQLVISEKLAAIGEITAGVAHEINNPIAVIQGNLDVIRDVVGPNLNSVQTELRLIDDQVHAINLIVTKLLQFAHPEEFSGHLDKQSPEDVIDDCLLLVQHLLNKVQIDIVRVSQSTGQVLINRTEFQQVLINLIVNAIHAMPDGGTLTLASFDRDDSKVAGITIEITDTGNGMSPEIAARIFDPFFTTKREDGTGLGLSISQTLITRHGGSLSVETALGSGTTFSVWMPVSS